MGLIISVDPRAWAMPEDKGDDSLDANIRRLLREYCLWGYHTRNSIGSESGWPDWVILPNGHGKPPLFRELKTQRGTLKPAQRAVGARLQLAGQDWAVWRPVDLLNGTINRQLERISW